MIKGTVLHEIFRRKVNRVNSNRLQAVSCIDVDAYLTEAANVIYKNLSEKFETNDYVAKILQPVIEREIHLSTRQLTDFTIEVTFPDNVYKLISKTAVGAKTIEEKEYRRDLVVNPVLSHQKSEVLKDPYWKPSFEWESVLFSYSNKGIIIYKDCDFEIPEIRIDYLRELKKITTPSLVRSKYYGKSGSYIDSEGNLVSSDVGLELDKMHQEVAHLAAIKFLADSGDQVDYQTQMNAILSDNKIFI